MRTNQTKAKLKAGETVTGCYMRHADPGLAEVLGHHGWDYLLFDAEHTPLSVRECEAAARACELTGVTPIVRVPANLPWMIGRVLDTGIPAVQIPMINTGEDALLAARAAKYPPRGTRGLASARAADYGQTVPFHLREHIESANNETLVIAQVETAASIDGLAAIVQVPDIDVIFIGPNDLSLSLGFPGEFNHPTVQKAFEQITDVVLKTDKALGIMVTTAEGAIEWQRRGARYIMTVLEAIMTPAVREFLRKVREA